MALETDKTRATSLLNGFKNVDKNRVSLESEQRFKLSGEDICIYEKQAVPYLYKEACFLST